MKNLLFLSHNEIQMNINAFDLTVIGVSQTFLIFPYTNTAVGECMILRLFYAFFAFHFGRGVYTLRLFVLRNDLIV